MTEAIAVTSALIAAVGLGFSGWQLRLIHKDREKDRELGILGVCLSWRPSSAPNEADVDADGRAIWTYVFMVSNPGRFPVSELIARVTFPAPVARVRHNGTQDDPASTLELKHPVLPGNSDFVWSPRNLITVFDPSPDRADIRAELSFVDSEGTFRTTIWPAPRRNL